MAESMKTAPSSDGIYAEADEWKPFPPPGVGRYHVRDSRGSDFGIQEVTKNSRGKLKCLGMYASSTMTRGNLDSWGYEWRPVK